jgi:hypothetical protein
VSRVGRWKEPARRGTPQPLNASHLDLLHRLRALPKRVWTVVEMCPERFVWLTAVDLGGGVQRPVREVVQGVYCTGLDPSKFLLKVLGGTASLDTDCSIAKNISTPPCSNGSTDTGAGHEQGEQQ